MVKLGIVMSIKDENTRITITISKRDLHYLEQYAELLKMNTSRLISRIVHLHCVVDLHVDEIDKK